MGICTYPIRRSGPNFRNSEPMVYYTMTNFIFIYLHCRLRLCGANNHQNTAISAKFSSLRALVFSRLIHLPYSLRATLNVDYSILLFIIWLLKFWHVRVYPTSTLWYQINLNRFTLSLLRIDGILNFIIMWWRHLAVKRQSWTRYTTTNLSVFNDIKTVSKFQLLNSCVEFTDVNVHNRAGQKNKHRTFPPFGEGTCRFCIS